MSKVIIPCRISYANIWEPKSIRGSDPKFSVSCLIPKTNTNVMTDIKSAIEEAIELGKTTKWGGKVPANLKLPIHDGDVERPDDSVYAGCYFINATSRDAPQIVDRRVRPILDRMDCGSGDYCNVSVNFYPFDSGVLRGVAAGLNNIQKVKDGERLGGRTSASSDFESLDDDEPNFLQ